MPNKLVLNEPRIGWFYDGYPEEVTPATATMLRDDGERITLTIPWQGFEAESGQLSRWFHGDLVEWGDDPDRVKFSYDLPSEIGFYDADGPVTLVGCRVLTFKGLLAQASHGVLTAQFAVIGARNLAWGKINALRTRVPGLGDWANLSAASERHETDEQGRLSRYELALEALPDQKLDRRLNLSLVSAWRVDRARDAPLSIHDDLVVQTNVRSPQEWGTHFDRHRAVMQLLEIADWRPLGLESVKAMRDSDPAKVLSGEIIGPQWLDVHTYAVRSPPLDPSRRMARWLFQYPDIGRAGVARWLRLRDRFSRGVLPIVGLHDVEKIQIETQLTQSCVGLEAIGYELALESGMTPAKANGLRFEHRAELIRQAINFDIIPTDWPARAASAYNGFKHANRPLPDFDSMFRAHRENLLAFRLWVAIRIGVSRRNLRARLDIDPIAQQVSSFTR